MKNRKKVLIALSLVMFMIALVVGLTYAIIEFTKLSGENSITTGRIKMSYTEPSNAMIISDALPMSDEQGKAQTDYFEFKVSSYATTNKNSNISIKIPYEVNTSSMAIDEGKEQLTDSEIKLYLTKVVNGEEEVLQEPILLKDLTASTLRENSTKIYAQEDIHKNGSEEIVTTYRLRVWIDSEADLSNIGNKQYKFRVNVNSNTNAKNDTSTELKATETLLKTWTSKAKNATTYIVFLTSNKKSMPDTYMYNGVEYTKQQEIDVSSASDGGVVLGEYKDADGNLIGIMGANGGILAPEDCSMLLPLISATTIDLKYLDTSNAVNMMQMFMCNKVTSLDLSNFNTSNVTNMNQMFNGCSNLSSLDISSFDTRNVTNMNMMFYNCSELISLDVSSFNTSNVITMQGMFAGNNVHNEPERYYMKLKTIKGLEKFNTSNVTSMATMFAGCTYITTLDLSNFDTSKVTNMSAMFANTTNLTNIIVGCDWQTATTATNMFNGAGVSEVTKVCN